MKMRSSNPLLKTEIFTQRMTYGSETMTIQGTVTKCALLLAIAFGSASITWSQFFQGNILLTQQMMLAGIVGGLISTIVTAFKPEWSMVTAPIYAIAEGFALGGMSAILESSYAGLPMQAVALSFATLAVMLVIYRTQMIQVNSRFAMIIAAGVGGVLLVRVVCGIAGAFGWRLIPFGSTMDILLSLIAAGLAAFNLMLNFEFIQQASRRSTAKYMEWYGAYSVMVTLVWLYVELLRILAAFQSRSKD
jgi:uncharacterized YccA/Bax inhibitor family protein